MALPEYAPDPTPLPPYHSTLYREGNLSCKIECVAPAKTNFGRRWFRADLVLNNTQLTVTRRFGATKVVSMQFAQVGFAGDYKKGKYPIRLRASGMQFLFECEELLQAIQWIQIFELSIAISLPIELRQEPPARYMTPRLQFRHRSRRNAGTEALDSDSSDDSSYHIDHKDSDALSCVSSTSEHSREDKVTSVLISPDDMPANTTFNLRDFGVILRQQKWETPTMMMV